MLRDSGVSGNHPGRVIAAPGANETVEVAVYDVDVRGLFGDLGAGLGEDWYLDGAKQPVAMPARA
jgi:hypothetical protein